MIVFSFNKPAGQVQLHLERVLARGLAAPVRLAGPRRRGGHQPRGRRPRDDLRDDPRHDDRARPDPLPVPRPRARSTALIFLPMATPEIVLGASLLTLFVATALPPLAGAVPLLYPTGFHTILIAHVMFNISFVVVTVKARLPGFDRRLEEAAMDLGANELTTFWKVTFPLILPGHPGRGAARVQPVDRRLRHHQLRLGHDEHVPDLGVLDPAQRAAGPDQRRRLDGVPRRGRARRSRRRCGPAARRASAPPRQRRSPAMVDTAPGRRRPSGPLPDRRSCRRSGAGSRTSSSTTARARG